MEIGLWSAACVAAGLLWSAPIHAVSTENLLFLEAWRGVDRAYVDRSFNHQNWLQLREKFLKKEPMANRQQTYEAIERMLATLNDPFTRFLDPSRFNALRGGTRGIVVGVGVEVAFTSGMESEPELMVVSPAPKSPALRAGVEPGDVLLEIDGVSTKNDSLYAVGEKLQGEKGSDVHLESSASNWNVKSLVASGAPSIKRSICRMHIHREEVMFNPVIDRYCTNVPGIKDGEPRGTLGYIQVLRFTSQTELDVRKAIQALKSKEVDRFVLDLRNNGGGSFPAGVAVSKMFLDTGDIVLIADTEGIRDIVSAEGTSLDNTTPLSVLINRGTASASEVLSGALQDNGRGTVIGEPSFGKGLIQTLIPLSDGSAVTITTAKYQTPSGKDINGTGIQPDVLLSANDVPFPFGDAASFCNDFTKAVEQIGKRNNDDK